MCLITNKMRGKNTTLPAKQFQNPITKSKKRQNWHPHTWPPPSWLGTGAPLKSIEVKLVLRAQTSPLSGMMGSCKYFSHVNKMSTLTYNRVNNFIYIFILNIIHVYLIFATQKLLITWYRYLFHLWCNLDLENIIEGHFVYPCLSKYQYNECLYIHVEKSKESTDLTFHWYVAAIQ